MSTIFCQSPKPVKLTQKQRIKALLADGEWHCCRELNAICFRYSARLHESVEFETKPCDCASRIPHGLHYRVMA